MPAPAVYVLAVVGTVAASFVFYQFVYEPHIAPKLEQWAENFLNKRRARRRQREMVAVPASSHKDSPFVDDDASSTLTSSSEDSDSNGSGSTRRRKQKAKTVYEMNILKSRSNGGDGLRNRKGGDSSVNHAVDEPVASTFKYPLMHPTHVISSSISSIATTPDVELPNPAESVATPRTAIPDPFADPTSHLPVSISGVFTLSPAEQQGPGSDTQAPPVRPATSRSQTTLSLSQSHPIDFLDAEHDIEVINYTPSPSLSSGSLSGLASGEPYGIDARFALSDDDVLSSISTSSRAESRMSGAGSEHEIFYSIHEAASPTSLPAFLPGSSAVVPSRLSGHPGSRRESVTSLSSSHSFAGSEVFSEGSWDRG